MRDGQHLADELGVFGMAQRRVAEQRAQRGQPGVAAAGGVPAAVLEVVQERGDRLGAEIVPVQVRGGFAGALLEEAQQQPEVFR